MQLRRMSRMVTVLLATATVALTAAAPVGAAPSRSGAHGQLAFYNHAYGVLDAQTADAIEKSDYLRTFSNFELRTTTGAQGSWTGRYLLGRETYVELFKVGDLPGPDSGLGAAGLAVSTERSGELATFRDRLADEGVAEPAEFAQTRDFGDGKPIPWFDAIFTSLTYDAFGAWAMEYRQSYLADPRSKVEPASFPGDVSRERYLNDGYRDKLMRDISGIRLAVTKTDLDNTTPLLRAAGYRVHKLAGGIVARGASATIRLDEVPRADAGLRQLDFTLNRPQHRAHVEQLGRSTLRVGPGKHATWKFPAQS